MPHRDAVLKNTAKGPAASDAGASPFANAVRDRAEEAVRQELTLKVEHKENGKKGADLRAEIKEEAKKGWSKAKLAIEGVSAEGEKRLALVLFTDRRDIPLSSYYLATDIIELAEKEGFRATISDNALASSEANPDVLYSRCVRVEW